MPKDRVCRYGNCVETTPVVSVSIEGERPVFCSLAHAALWLLIHPRTRPWEHEDVMADLELAMSRIVSARLTRTMEKEGKL